MEAMVDDLPVEVREFADAYHAHDPEAMVGFYAPDAVFNFPGIQLRGRDQIKELWAGWFEAFPDVKSEWLPTMGRPGTTALHWEESGTHLGKLNVAGFNLPASGKRLCWRGVSVYVQGEEGFESVTYYVDRFKLALQLMTPRTFPGMLRAGVKLLREERQNS